MENNSKYLWAEPIIDIVIIIIIMILLPHTHTHSHITCLAAEAANHILMADFWASVAFKFSRINFWARLKHTRELKKSTTTTIYKNNKSFYGKTSPFCSLLLSDSCLFNFFVAVVVFFSFFSFFFSSSLTYWFLFFLLFCLLRNYDKNEAVCGQNSRVCCVWSLTESFDLLRLDSLSISSVSISFSLSCSRSMCVCAVRTVCR